MSRRTSLSLRYLFLLFVLMAAVFFFAGCGKKNAQAAGQGMVRPPAPVVVAAVEQRDIPVQVQAIGNVQAYQTVQIKSLVDGQINGILFKEGQDVHKGQLLVTLDKRPFQADLDKAIGTLKHDQAQAANSQAQTERYTKLEKEGIISHEQAQQYQTQAQADASAVQADKAAVESARVQLQYCDIYSPLNARTGALLINNGNLVKANDTNYLVQLNQVSPIYVEFAVPETALSEIRQYAGDHLKVFASAKGQTDGPSEGTLTFIDNGVDPTTGTIKLKATFANSHRRLWPGEFVNVVMNITVHKNAVLVPTKAVETGQQGEYVYVVTPQNTAEARAVKTDGSYQNTTLIATGLKPGERVVVNGQLRVVPNGKVVVQSTMASTGTASASAENLGGGQ
jgi:membrane fusion protein, multidrug efflux system